MRGHYFTVALLIVLLPFCSLHCAGVDREDFCSKWNTPVKPPPAVKYEPPSFTIAQKILSTAEKYKPHLITLTILVILFTAYRLEKTIQSRKKIKLNDKEIAIFGLLAEIAEDLWHSIKNRTRAKIIPFTRRN